MTLSLSYSGKLRVITLCLVIPSTARNLQFCLSKPNCRSLASFGMTNHIEGNVAGEKRVR